MDLAVRRDVARIDEFQIGSVVHRQTVGRRQPAALDHHLALLAVDEQHAIAMPGHEPLDIGIQPALVPRAVFVKRERVNLVNHGAHAAHRAANRPNTPGLDECVWTTSYLRAAKIRQSSRYALKSRRDESRNPD